MTVPTVPNLGVDYASLLHIELWLPIFTGAFFLVVIFAFLYLSRTGRINIKQLKKYPYAAVILEIRGNAIEPVFDKIRIFKDKDTEAWKYEFRHRPDKPPVVDFQHILPNKVIILVHTGDNEYKPCDVDVGEKVLLDEVGNAVKDPQGHDKTKITYVNLKPVASEAMKLAVFQDIKAAAERKLELSKWMQYAPIIAAAIFVIGIIISMYFLSGTLERAIQSNTQLTAQIVDASNNLAQLKKLP
jgi:hypothetical protein